MKNAHIRFIEWRTFDPDNSWFGGDFLVINRICGERGTYETQDSIVQSVGQNK